MEPTDLFLAKCVANREKDRTFNLALLIHGIVNADEALARLTEMPINAVAQKKLAALIRRLHAQAREKSE